MVLSVKNQWVIPQTLTWIVTLLALTMMTLPKSVDSSHDSLFLCMKNCEQCESMYGAYFEGDLCAKSCFRMRGSFIPDCIDMASIAPFLNKNE